MEKMEKKGLVTLLVYVLLGVIFLVQGPHIVTHLQGKECFEETCLADKPNTLTTPIVRP